MAALRLMAANQGGDVVLHSRARHAHALSRRAWRQVCRALVTANRPNRTGFRLQQKLTSGLHGAALPMNCAGNQIVGHGSRRKFSVASLHCIQAAEQSRCSNISGLGSGGAWNLGHQCLLRPVFAGDLRNGGVAMLLRQLSRFAALSPHEIDLVEAACGARRRFAPAPSCSPRAISLHNVRLLVSGWACQQRVLSDGRRQIFGFALPGDLFGSCCRSASIAQTTAVVLKSGTIANVTFIRDVLLESPRRFAGLASAFAGLQTLHEGYLLNHLVRLGRQTAYERIAHLLLELDQRAAAVGLAEAGRARCP